MGIQTQSALIAAILLVAIGVNVLAQDRRVRHRATFFGFVAGLVLYNASFFAFGLAPDAPLARRIVLLAALLTAPLTLRFFQHFLGDVDRRIWRSVAVGSLLVGAVIGTELALTLYYAVLVSVYALGVAAWSIYRLYRRYSEVDSEVDAARLLYLVVGGGLAVTFSATDLLPLLGVPFPTMGHLLTTLYVYLLMQVVQRSRLLDLQEFLGRVLTFGIQAVVISLVFVGLTIWVGDRVGLFFFNAVLASMVLILVYEPVLRVVERWLARLLFTETFELEDALARLSRGLANVIDPAVMVDRVLEGLEGSRRITHAAICMLESDGRGYRVAGRLGPIERSRVDVVSDRALLDALAVEPVLLRDHVDRERAEATEEAADGEDPTSLERLRGVAATMAGLSAELVFPFLSGDRLLGFLCIKDDRTSEPFSSFEIGLIRGLSRQCTVVLENSELFDRLKERDRLQALGEMAAGLAHEIRNPLGAIKGAAQLLDPGDSIEDEQAEFVQVIVEEVDRLDTVLRQFLDYARPSTGAVDRVDVNRAVERVATLVRTEATEPPLDVKLDLAEQVPAVLMDPSQLQQILINLARNAREALPDGGTLTLSTATVGDTVEIRVADDGPGIPDSVRRNLFVPFFTTKREGTGLGLPISQRIVEKHGGAISVRSRLGSGTTFVVRFPSADAPRTETGAYRPAAPGGEDAPPTAKQA
jgi:signal transduction histidine kinase